MEWQTITAPGWVLRELQKHWNTSESITWTHCGINPAGEIQIEYIIPGSDTMAVYTTMNEEDNMHMIERLWEDEVQRAIDQAMKSMFQHGAGRTTDARVQHHLGIVAKRAFQAGKTYALMGLMTAADVAEHFDISERRARKLIENRHERFAVGMKAGATWLVHRDDLPQLEPDARFRPGD